MKFNKNVYKMSFVLLISFIDVKIKQIEPRHEKTCSMPRFTLEKFGQYFCMCVYSVACVCVRVRVCVTEIISV